MDSSAVKNTREKYTALESIGAEQWRAFKTESRKEENIIKQQKRAAGR